MLCAILLNVIMNVIAGVLIGIGNETWWTCILASIGWGFVYCVHKSIFRTREIANYLQRIEDRGQPIRWGMNPRFSFYLIEFNTAVATSIIVSLIVSGIRRFFSL